MVKLIHYTELKGKDAMMYNQYMRQMMFFVLLSAICFTFSFNMIHNPVILIFRILSGVSFVYAMYVGYKLLPVLKGL